jgi:hypothetical protein
MKNLTYTTDTIKRELESIMAFINDDFNKDDKKHVERIERYIENAMFSVARQKAIDIKNMIETI